MRTARTLTIVTVAAAVAASSVLAAGPSVPWTKKDMTTAIRAIGYPKPHPKKLACRGVGAIDSAGRFVSFRCIATYSNHRRRVFYTAGQGLPESGWICAGPHPSPCKLLRKGFIPTAEANLQASQAGVAENVAKGYLVNHNLFPYQVTRFCEQSSSGWSCPFTVNAQPVTVTVNLKAAKGGYVTTASSS